MSAKRPEDALLRLYEEVINQGRIDIIEDLYAPGYVNHVAPFELSQGVDGLKILFGEFMMGFPDQHIVADEIFSVGDRVVARWTLTATHRGTFFGVPATGRRIVMTGIDLEQVVNDKILAHWGAEDMLGLLQQIGAIPPIGGAH